MKKIVVSIIAVLGLSIISTNSFADQVWTLTEDSVTLNLKGVSPYAEKIENGADRLYFASESALPDPIMVVDCVEGSCTRKSITSRFGSDATIVTLKNGVRKVFFVEMGPSGKSIKFATLGADGLSHGSVSAIDVEGSIASQNEGAWGVPDAVVLPDGRVRIYWVLKDLATGKPRLPEALVSATSTDSSATTFKRDPGLRLTGGYVDSEILRAQDGDWIMMVSTGPGAGTQKLYMATSRDGLTWALNENSISSSNESALDPTGYEIAKDTWRIYYASAAPGMVVDRVYTLKRATLKLAEVQATPTPTPTPTPIATESVSPSPTPTTSSIDAPKVSASPTVSSKISAKKITITCVKGKTLKKVTSVNPKCPAGYKKK
ncbi:MAG: hypothetical protein RL193_619 [Actinomycetota bacterium]|jgi:hypothetical protein